MTIDPEAAALLAMLAAQPAVEMHDGTIAEIRASFVALAALGVGEVPAIGGAVDVDADGVPARVYTPAGARHDGGFPVVVYLHGGGWAIGSVDAYDAFTRLLAAETGALVVSVDYRLAPEHPHPAAVDDCWTALRWAAAHAGDHGGDATRLAVAGDSAGGNLAAVMAQLATETGAPHLALQALLYPVTDCDFDRPSYLANGEGRFLERTSMRYFFDAYCRGGTDPADPRVSPLRATDLAGLPPALVVTAELDPLRDEGTAYAGAMRGAGVPVEERCYEGMIHGFVAMPALLAGGRRALDRVVAALRAALGSV